MEMVDGRNTNQTELSARKLGQARRVAFSSLVGTSIEWYDYFLYGMFAVLIFNKVFFTDLDPTAGTIASLLTFALGFVARPLGGIVFGHIGDRVGRKAALIATLLLIGTATGLIGVLPTYEQIGLAAPILLACLRFVQGLSVGGEWGGAMVMVVEHAPAKRKALYGAMPQLGSPIGTLVSSGVIALVMLLPEDQLLSWGWRVPFLLAFPLMAVTIYLRVNVEESPLFAELKAKNRAPKFPLGALLRRYKVRLLVAISATLFVSGAFYVMTTYAVSYGSTVLGIAPSSMLLATTVGAAVEGVLIVVAGLLADRFRAWKVMTWGLVGLVVLTIPLTAAIATASTTAVLVAVIVGIGMIGIPYGVLGTVLSEMFPPEVRYSGLAITYNVAGMIGGFTPAIAVALAAQFDNSVLVIGYLFGGICLLSSVGSLIAGLLIRRNG